jgi:hypothetical protein
MGRDSTAIGELKEWHKRDIPAQAREFDQPKEGWTSWQKRYVLRWAGKYNNRVGDRSFIHIPIVVSECSTRHCSLDLTDIYLMI